MSPGLGHLHYVAFVLLLCSGLYLTLACRNLVRKLIGLYLTQTSVMLFYLSLGVRLGSAQANPLPQALMLTAIVVGLATLGVSLSLLLRLHRGYGTLEEDELLAKINEERA